MDGPGCTTQHGQPKMNNPAWTTQDMASPAYGQPRIWPTQHVANPAYGHPSIWPTQDMANPGYGQPSIWPTQHLANPVFGKPSIWTSQHTDNPERILQHGQPSIDNTARMAQNSPAWVYSWWGGPKACAG
jgi:hypothetical protein